jgi:hypothetical protein
MILFGLGRSTGVCSAIPRSGYFATCSYVVLFISCFTLFGCSSKPVRLAAHIPVPKYFAFAGQSQGSGNHAGPLVEVSYPILEIFAPDGRLIYQGDDIFQNLALLHQPETNLAKLAPVASHLRLQDLVDQVNEFRPYGQELRRSNRYTFVSVSLKGCGSCRTQDDVLQESNGTANTQTNKLFLVLDP